jgi:uncharacterized protein (TIGR01777 family)
MKDLVPLPKIIIAGGTGFLGQLLAQSFLKDGYDVVLLSRNIFQTGVQGRLVEWDGESTGDWVEELEESRALINLTGRSIDCRHSSSNRQEILDSRIKSTRVLGEALNHCIKPPTVWLNASSMAVYGQCIGYEEAHDESSPIAKSGFLEEVTVAWEDEFFKFNNPNVRKVAMRISFILGRSSGAFPLLKKLTSFGLGGKQGSGKQWMSWLHEDDWVGISRFLLEEKDITGPVNLASPIPVKNKDFMRLLRSHFAPLGLGLPAPSFGVRIGCFLLGSAPELALQSRRVTSTVLEEKKYSFTYSSLNSAICSLLE